jgi:hypothetical protein
MDIKKYINKKTVFSATAYIFGMTLSAMAAHYGPAYFLVSTAAIMVGAVIIDRRVK